MNHTAIGPYMFLMVRAASPKGGDRAHLDIRRAPGLPAIELHTGRAFTHSHPPHWHDEYFVTAMTGGEGVFHFRGQDHRAPAGTLVLVVPGEVHSHASGPGGRSFRSLHAGNVLISALAPELPPRLRSSAITDARLLQKFLSLHRLLGGEGSALRKESRMLDFFLEVAGRVPEMRSRSMPRPERAAVRRARDLLDESCSSRVTLRDLASLAGLSPYHFHRIFRLQTGMPPHEYHLRRRLVRARRLLAEGHRVADVAAATGFADQSHLTRHFKRMLGLPPADFSRRSRRSKNVQDAVPARL